MKTIELPEKERLETPETPALFQVWIDLAFGEGDPDWWWNSEPQELASALNEASDLRSGGWVCKIMPDGMNPRTDGRWDNP